MFFWTKYARALQEILGTDSGKASSGLMGLSPLKMGMRIETGVRNDPECKDISKRLSPVEAALVSVGRTGMSLQKLGSTEASRLCGHSLQLALIEYAELHPDVKQLVGMLLMDWEEKLPSGSYSLT